MSGHPELYFLVPRGVGTTTPNWYPIPIPDDQFLEKGPPPPPAPNTCLSFSGNQYGKRMKTITKFRLGVYSSGKSWGPQMLLPLFIVNVSGLFLVRVKKVVI